MLDFSEIRAQGNPTLIYIGDPMCSWCYGFSEEITEVKKYAESQGIGFKLILGGLRPGGTETMAELSEFLKHHWEQVHDRSGQPFGYDILKDKSFVYDTEPPCRAVVTAAGMDNTVTLEYFKAVQKAFYRDGKNTNNVETYKALAVDFGLDPARFEELYHSEEIKNQTLANFQAAAKMGVRGFPAVVVSCKGRFTLVTNGYTGAKKLIRAINKAIEESKK